MTRTESRGALAALLSALALAACASAPTAPEPDLAALEARYDAALAELRAAKAALAAASPAPRTLSFGELGSLDLNEVRLGGYPGHVFLRVHYTYENTSDEPVDAVRVTLLVRDLDQDLEWGEASELRMPYLLTMHEGSTYTSWFEVPLDGLYRAGDWEYELRLEAQRDGVWTADGTADA